MLCFDLSVHLSKGAFFPDVLSQIQRLQMKCPMGRQKGKFDNQCFASLYCRADSVIDLTNDKK